MAGSMNDSKTLPMLWYYDSTNYNFAYKGVTYNTVTNNDVTYKDITYNQVTYIDITCNNVNDTSCKIIKKPPSSGY